MADELDDFTAQLNNAEAENKAGGETAEGGP
jgi:hypothetical protein